MSIDLKAPAPEKPASVLVAEQADAASIAEGERIDQAVLFSGEPHTVALRDGTTCEVRVRVVCIRELPRFLALQDDEAALVEFVTGQPQGWADTLMPDAHFQLVGRARALNFPSALRWTLSQLAMQEWLTSGVIGRATPKASPRLAPESATSSAGASSRSPT